MDENQDTSLVCLNGHMINNRTRTLPKSSKNHCPDCGEPTISNCPNCHADIPGATYKDDGYFSEWTNSPYSPESYCHDCGKPYPWMERKIQAAVEMIDLLDEISEDEKNKLKADIPDIIHKSPRSEVACMRYKTVLGKISGMARDVFVNVVSDIASETIKKSMGL